MNWESIGAIAETVGAIATVLMLIYLAIQIRHNTRAVRASFLYSANTSLTETFSRTPEEAEIKYKDWELRTNSEKLQHFETLAAHFTLFEAMYFLNLEGTIDPELWKSRSEHIELHLGTTGGREFWANRRQWFASSFRMYVDMLYEPYES